MNPTSSATFSGVSSAACPSPCTDGQAPAATHPPLQQQQNTAAASASTRSIAPAQTDAPTASAPALHVHHLAHSFGPRTVLKNISLTLPAGQVLALVGPSGCGKSTLLHLCAGLLDLREGRIDNGFAQTTMLFQQPNLLPWKTTLDNIALSLKARGVGRAERTRQARAMGHRLGLDDMALNQFPHQLSGGMQSRAALARALVLQPDLLLLDEPFSALDIGLRAQMHQLLLSEQQRRQLTVMMITHDLTEAMTLADVVLVMGGSPGHLVWRLDLPLPAPQRDDGWIHQHTGALLAQPLVRRAFDLPDLHGASPAIGTATDALPAGNAGHAVDAEPDDNLRRSRC